MSQLIQMLPILDDARPVLAAQMRSSESAAEFLKPGLAWGGFYDMTITEHLACFCMVAGLLEPLVLAAATNDPVAELFKPDAGPDCQEWNGGTEGQFGWHDLLGALYSLLGSVESVVLYGYYLNELLAMSFEDGDDEALFNAIRVDPMVVTSEKAAHRISVAVVKDDQRFLKSMQNALKGKTGKQARYLKKFKFLMQLLLEAGMLGKPNKEIRALALQLGAYANDPNAEKNLNAQILKFRKKKTISD
ncbi:MAG: hypothetical protein JWR22_902 [Herminiimonas sp.]|nr:hypothetical protein [Herminiimonas sp.]